MSAVTFKIKYSDNFVFHCYWYVTCHQLEKNLKGSDSFVNVNGGCFG